MQAEQPCSSLIHMETNKRQLLTAAGSLNRLPVTRYRRAYRIMASLSAGTGRVQSRDAESV